MRIISGKYRRRKLKSPKGLTVRPTLDHVKEALFSTLGVRVKGAVFGDFFSGSGSIGVEALSRGAEKVVFIEKNFHNRKLIKENCLIFSPEDSQKLRILHEAQTLWRDEEWQGFFDIVFYDPPYAYYEKLIQQGALGVFMQQAFALLKEDGVFALEAPFTFVAALRGQGFKADKERKYGHIRLLYFEKDGSRQADAIGEGADEEPQAEEENFKL